MYLLGYGEGTRKSATFCCRRLCALPLSTAKHCKSCLLWLLVSWICWRRSRLLFSSTYKAKYLKRREKNAPFRLECWGCNLSYRTWKRNFQFQLVWRGMGWWKNLRALLKCKMLPVYGTAPKGNIREDLWLKYSVLPGQNNETLLLRFTSLENRLQTSIKAWKYYRL